MFFEFVLVECFWFFGLLCLHFDCIGHWTWKNLFSSMDTVEKMSIKYLFNATLCTQWSCYLVCFKSEPTWHSDNVVWECVSWARKKCKQKKWQVQQVVSIVVLMDGFFFPSRCTHMKRRWSIDQIPLSHSCHGTRCSLVDANRVELICYAGTLESVDNGLAVSLIDSRVKRLIVCWSPRFHRRCSISRWQIPASNA